MKSIKNHLSLVLALVSILFALQSIKITDRAIDAYTQKLRTNYSLVIVANKTLNQKMMMKKFHLIEKIEPIAIDDTIKKIDKNISQKNLELLKVTLPKFYKISLQHYPTPQEIDNLKNQISKISGVKQIEDFKASYDITYKLLVLFEIVVKVFSVVVFVITLLLISKELRIWQFKHKERMNIMGLFGAPKWLSSAVLFRLAIVDAIISSIVVMLFFNYIAASRWLLDKFDMIGINIVVFDMTYDFGFLVLFALIISVLLAIFIVFGHKEEV